MLIDSHMPSAVDIMWIAIIAKYAAYEAEFHN